MKKLLVILIVLTTIFSGCRYKEGPMISFRSIKQRLDGHGWSISELTSDGIDSLKYFNDSCGGRFWFSFPFEEQSGIQLMEGKKSINGAFSFNDNKKIMTVNLGSNWSNIIAPLSEGKKDWKILKLTNKIFKISTDVNGKHYVITFKL